MRDKSAKIMESLHRKGEVSFELYASEANRSAFKHEADYNRNTSLAKFMEKTAIVAILGGAAAATGALLLNQTGAADISNAVIGVGMAVSMAGLGFSIGADQQREMAELHKASIKAIDESIDKAYLRENVIDHNKHHTDWDDPALDEIEYDYGPR